MSGTDCGTCGTSWKTAPCSSLHAEVYKARHHFSADERETIAAFQRARNENRPWKGVLPWKSACWEVAHAPSTPYFGRLYLPVWDTVRIPETGPIPAFHSVSADTREGAIEALRALAARDYGCELAEEEG